MEISIWSYPKILIIHLNYIDSCDTLVNFPLENLDLSQFITGPVDVPPIYDLYAIANTYGRLGGGHSSTFALHRDYHQWYFVDDSRVVTTNPSALITNGAMLLFYKRKDIPWTKFDMSLENNEPEEDL